PCSSRTRARQSFGCAGQVRPPSAPHSARSKTSPCRQGLLAARYSLLNCSVRTDQCAREFIHAEATKNVEHECDLRLLGEVRVTTGEHHPQQVVFNRVRRECFFNHRSERPFTFQQTSQFRREGAGCPLAAEQVKGAVFCRGHQPGGRVFRHT